MPFFLAGYYFRNDIVEKITTKKVRIFAIAVLTAIAIFIIFNLPIINPYRNILYGGSSYIQFHHVISEEKVLILRAIWYLIAFVMTFAVMSLIPKRKTIISYIGSRTLSIYIVHRLIRQIVMHYDFYQYFDKNGITLLLFCLVISGVVTFALSGKWLYNLFQMPFKIRYTKLITTKHM